MLKTKKNMVLLDTIHHGIDRTTIYIEIGTGTLYACRNDANAFKMVMNKGHERLYVAGDFIGEVKAHNKSAHFLSKSPKYEHLHVSEELLKNQTTTANTMVDFFVWFVKTRLGVL